VVQEFLLYQSSLYSTRKQYRNDLRTSPQIPHKNHIHLIKNLLEICNLYQNCQIAIEDEVHEK